jgi:hypothetical protein
VLLRVAASNAVDVGNDLLHLHPFPNPLSQGSYTMWNAVAELFKQRASFVILILGGVVTLLGFLNVSANPWGPMRGDHSNFHGRQ